MPEASVRCVAAPDGYQSELRLGSFFLTPREAKHTSRACTLRQFGVHVNMLFVVDRQSTKTFRSREFESVLTTHGTATTLLHEMISGLSSIGFSSLRHASSCCCCCC